MVRFSFTIISNIPIFSSSLDSFTVINSLVVFAERTSFDKIYSKDSSFSHIKFKYELGKKWYSFFLSTLEIDPMTDDTQNH